MGSTFHSLLIFFFFSLPHDCREAACFFVAAHPSLLKLSAYDKRFSPFAGASTSLRCPKPKHPRFSAPCVDNSGPPDALSFPRQQLGIGRRFWDRSTHLLNGAAHFFLSRHLSRLFLLSRRAWQRIDIARSILSNNGPRISSSTNLCPRTTTTSLLGTHPLRIPKAVPILEAPWQPQSHCRPSTTPGPAATGLLFQLAEAT